MRVREGFYKSYASTLSTQNKIKFEKILSQNVKTKILENIRADHDIKGLEGKSTYKKFDKFMLNVKN